jgi:hypothetical protein
MKLGSNTERKTKEEQVRTEETERARTVIPSSVPSVSSCSFFCG